MPFGCLPATDCDMKTPLCLLIALLLHLSITRGATIPPTSATTAATPLPERKAGTCPQASLLLGECNTLCTSDYKCEGNRKCCRTGCDGYACRIPDDKAGSCPQEAAGSETSCDKMTPCLSDSKCLGDLKCCLTSCNVTTCLPPM